MRSHVLILLGILSIVYAYCIVPQASATKARAVRPPQSVNSNPSFAVFHAKVVAAVEARDKEALLALVHQQCIAPHPAFDGREGFERFWFGVGAPGGDVWKELEIALELGGRFLPPDKEAFVIPYTAMAPAMDKEGQLMGVVLEHGTELHAVPGRNTPVRMALSRSIVRYCKNREVPYKVDDIEWICVLDPAGKPGFVESTQIRSPLALSFGFAKLGDQWWMMNVASGQ